MQRIHAKTCGGNQNLSSMARYTQVTTDAIRATQSPLDRLSLQVTPPG
jgi:hypothetical protein